MQEKLEALTLSQLELLMSERANALVTPSNSDSMGPAGIVKPARFVEKLAWVCTSCERECVPITSESRCLCGHRRKEHKDGRCTNRKCCCAQFFFIVAEGSWILRCRCKHKHVEHHPVTHACSRGKCDCGKFSSPWVCNCDHPWADHQQRTSSVQVPTLEAMMQRAELQESSSAPVPAASMAPEVNRWDLVKRGSS